MSNPPLLELDGLSLGRAGRTVAGPLTLRFSAGEKGLLLGANGSGKTTLVETLCGQRRPLGGTMKVPSRLGLVPQEPAFPKHLKVMDYLRQLVALRGESARAVEQVHQALQRFALEADGERRIGQLSRGWRQRLNLARAWLGQPDLLLMDEPQTALDPDGMEALAGAIESRGEMAVLIVSPPGVGCEDLAPVLLELASSHRETSP